MSVLLFVFITALSGYSQQFNNWRNYSDLKDINAFALSGNEVWAATAGGVFSYNFQDQSYKVLSKTDGLNGGFITSVTVDNSGKVWFGSADGKIDVYNPESGSFKTLLDIFTSDKPNKKINQLRTSGDTIFASTDFGISLINSENYFFYDTYFKFGTLTSNIKVNSSYKDLRIYSCTEVGLAISKTNAVNLSAPESWDVYQTINGLVSNNVLKVLQYNDTLIAATDKGFSFFNQAGWNPYLSFFNNQVISDVIVKGDSLIILSQNRIRSYYNGEITDLFTGSTALKKIEVSTLNGFLAASSNGILNLQGTTQQYFAPNCPPANKFREITADVNGVLWSATGKNNGGIGVMKFENYIWSVYNVATNPELNSNDYYCSYSAPDNTKYFGNWGSGFARFRNNVITTFNTANTDITGFSGDVDFLVVTALNTDSRNNLWVLNYASADRKNLSMLTPDSSWYHFAIPSEQNRYLEQHYFLAIDAYNTKWFACYDALRNGLLYFNENGTYGETNDDKSGFLTSTNGLNSNTITALAVDRRGDLWIGTPSGMNVLSNNQAALSQANNQFRISSVFLLRQQAVNSIVVDPLNQKWVATNQGLLLVNADGTRLIAAFDSRNSSLLSDQVLSVTMDNNTGTVYAATAEGLTSFKTIAVSPVESFTELFIYPNPLVLSADNTILTIDGLIRDCDIKILSISGKLIREFVTAGGRIANWDGRDEFGNFVPSGVYLIVAYDQEGNSVTTSKIAVLRE
ncbi:MAG: hypothetical protein IPM56_03900 [Ignavibacteriales bacterium]|nr:MAG: hypothetical protein IPM56_03900 [Ignavibacteriales bacterium]